MFDKGETKMNEIPQIIEMYINLTVENKDEVNQYVDCLTSFQQDEERQSYPFQTKALT